MWCFLEASAELQLILSVSQSWTGLVWTLAKLWTCGLPSSPSSHDKGLCNLTSTPVPAVQVAW